MIVIKEVSLTLTEMGRRLREQRIARGESQELFATRIGVSRPTIRAIEQGEPTVQVGHWMAACWALNRLADMRDAFAGTVSLLDLPVPPKRPRVRASRRVIP